MKVVQIKVKPNALTGEDNFYITDGKIFYVPINKSKEKYIDNQNANEKPDDSQKTSPNEEEQQK